MKALMEYAQEKGLRRVLKRNMVEKWADGDQHYTEAIILICVKYVHTYIFGNVKTETNNHR